MVTDRKTEIYQDIVTNAEKLLQLLSTFEETNATPEGRMISQLKWLIDEVKQNRLALPVDQNFTGTLRHVYSEGYLDDIPEAKLFHKRLLKLTDNQLLLKEEHVGEVISKITDLQSILDNSPRPLTTAEMKSITDLETLKNMLESSELTPPIEYSNWDKFPELREVFSLTGSTIDDIPGAEPLVDDIVYAVFEGVRERSA